MSACALAALALPASASADRSTLFNQPGTYTYLVGPGVTSLQVQAIGGNGGRDSSSQSGSGGKGAVISADLPVTPGQVLTVVVGGNGGNGLVNGGAPGFNGGGRGGFSSGGGGGAGGGGTDVRLQNGTRLIVAGGGGGAGGTNGGFDAGSGGTSIDGGVGTNSAGGAGGAPLGTGSGFAGGAGSSGQGGNGGPGYVAGGGGGGGGYFGGGGGGGTAMGCPCGFSGRGGGGSSFADASATNVTGPTTPGGTNPAVTITPLNPPPDTQAPAISIATPANGATYTKNQVLNADYSCADEQGGEGLATCVGDVADGSPIDTSTFGSHSFAVTATDNVGNSDTKTVNYTVADTTDPTVTITTPADNASYARGQVVNAAFSCADEPNGAGLASCVGTVPNGSPIDTTGHGQKAFAVTATDNAGNDFTRTFHYAITDTADPTVTIDSPADGAVLARGVTVNADYSCSDEAGGSGLATCVGDVPDGSAIATSTLGAKTFSVTATDNAGNDFTKTVNYTVSDQTDPTATIASPADNATFARGEVVNADYSCADEANGSGIAGCSGTVADGSPIHTSSSGQKTFEVTATDNAGNDFTRTFHYMVTDTADPSATIDSPVDGASVPRGEIVRAGYSCTDEAGGSGVASCVGDVADGDPIDTSAIGSFAFSVTATDNAGNDVTETVSYAVRAPAVDPDPPAQRPDTEITHFDVNQLKGKLVVSLVSAPEGARFECRVDDGQFTPCDSPVTLRKLSPGRHKFRARAMSQDGTPDQTPAKRRFRIADRG
jgi:fibronectin type 3 domain-containing protein